MKPCIVCGRIREIKVFCKNCYLQKNPLLESFRPVSLTKCTKCNRYLLNNLWTKESLEKILPKTLKNKLNLNRELKNPELDFKVNESLILNISGTIENVRVSEEYEMPIEIKERVCLQCSRQKTSYYEAILQIRKPSHVLLYTLQKELEKNNRLPFLSKELNVPNGIDYYFSSKKIAIELAKTLKRRLGGKLKFSKRLFSRDRQSSRDLYRHTILYESASRDNK